MAFASPSPAIDARTAFISGPIDASPAYFDRYYKAQIDEAVARGDTFVLGPLSGIDTLALSYLVSEHAPPVAPSRVVVYMASFEYNGYFRVLVENLGIKGIKVQEAGTTTRMRDAAMTNASDYDVLRYRTERECKRLFGKAWRRRVSSTEMNERRRAAFIADDTGAAEVERYIQHLSRTEWWIRALLGKSGTGAGGAQICVGKCEGHRGARFWGLLIGIRRVE